MCPVQKSVCYGRLAINMKLYTEYMLNQESSFNLLHLLWLASIFSSMPVIFFFLSFLFSLKQGHEALSLYDHRNLTIQCRSVSCGPPQQPHAFQSAQTCWPNGAHQSRLFQQPTLKHPHCFSLVSLNHLPIEPIWFSLSWPVSQLSSFMGHIVLCFSKQPYLRPNKIWTQIK